MLTYLHEVDDPSGISTVRLGPVQSEEYESWLVITSILITPLIDSCLILEENFDVDHFGANHHIDFLAEWHLLFFSCTIRMESSELNAFPDYSSRIAASMYC